MMYSGIRHEVQITETMDQWWATVWDRGSGSFEEFGPYDTREEVEVSVSIFLGADYDG